MFDGVAEVESGCTPPDLANNRAIRNPCVPAAAEYSPRIHFIPDHSRLSTPCDFGAPRPGIVIDDITHGAGVAGHPPVTCYTRSHCLGATGGASSLLSSTPPRPRPPPPPLPPPPSSSPPPLRGIATQVRLEWTCPCNARRNRDRTLFDTFRYSSSVFIYSSKSYF